MLRWLRPTNIKFPTVWRTFKGTDSRKDYWIQNVTGTYRPEIIKFSLYSFLHDEPLTQLFGASYESKVREFSKIWDRMLDQGICIICLTNNNNAKPIITGVNYTIVLSKDDNFYSVKTSFSVDRNVDKFFKAMEFIEQKGILFHNLGINEYLSSFGLYVQPRYRRDGIGHNLLAARDSLCETFGLQATAAVFTSEASQKSAAKAGFKDLRTVTYKELIQKMQLTHSQNEDKLSSIKLMYKSYK